MSRMPSNFLSNSQSGPAKRSSVSVAAIGSSHGGIFTAASMQAGWPGGDVVASESRDEYCNACAAVPRRSFTTASGDPLMAVVHVGRFLPSLGRPNPLSGLVQHADGQFTCEAGVSAKMQRAAIRSIGCANS